MNHTKLSSLILIIAIFMLWGCGQSNSGSQKTISTDVITNPNTASGNSEFSELPVIHFDEFDHDFGRIIEGETVSYSFNFTNTGKSDLIIAEVSTSCGCTSPSYSKVPIRPGEKGNVKVAFNSKGRRGFQNKTIVVVTNSQPNTTTLMIKAQVVNPETEK